MPQQTRVAAIPGFPRDLPPADVHCPAGDELKQVGAQYRVSICLVDANDIRNADSLRIG